LDPREAGRIAERLQDAAPLAPREVEVADGPIHERKPQTMLADDLDHGYVHELSTRSMLGIPTPYTMRLYA
jgi:hypothetical protein